jgi:hypothetical protein
MMGLLPNLVLCNFSAISPLFLRCYGEASLSPHKKSAPQRGLFKMATIKKTPVLKREELYQGLIEPGWGAGLLNPASAG